MRHLSALLKRFAKDERGVFAVLFGLMAIVLVALSGAVVDYVSLEQTRSRAQIALDAAALGLQPEIFKTGHSREDIEALAQAILNERIGDARVRAEIEETRINVDDGSLYFKARFWMPTMFVSLVGVQTLGAAVESEATRKKLELEVVMVLDNSGSMDRENRMTRLVDAAKCATYILMYSAVVDAPRNPNTCVPAPGATLVEDVRIGIVPFTMFVNVGASNANASWIDRFGASAIHFDNFDNDDDEDRLVLTHGSTYSFPTRQQLFAATREPWLGCVEARPHIKTGSRPSEYLDTDDTAPVGGNTLYVPMFAPDVSSGNGANNYITNDSPAVCDRPGSTAICEITQERTRTWYGTWSSPTIIRTVPKGPEDFVSSALYPNAFYGKRPPGCSCRTSVNYGNWSSGTSVQTRVGTCSGSGGYIPADLSSRELQERVCKYYGGINSSSATTGPNADCIRTPILPLTTDPARVITTIGNMTAVGGTNIHEGAAWGFRVLSPTEPFTEGGPYDEAISKVMIIMTDGENTTYQANNINGATYNSAYGYPYNSRNTNANSTSGGNINRLGQANATDAQLVTEMNERTTQTCANAKAAGITVYTIGLATDKVTQSTEEVVKGMLTGCATSPDRARFPTYSSELKATFEAIANDLSALRLAL